MTEYTRDFTPPKKDIHFTIDNDIFHVVNALPAFGAMEISGQAEQFEGATTEERHLIIKKMFELILMPESAELFIARLSDPTNPIGAETILDIVPWVMEALGLRPTTLPSSSSNGSENPESGMNLRVVAPVTELTSAP